MTVTLFEGNELLTVVGESNYQDALWHVVAELGREAPAVLTPEPDNPYDSNAIAVVVGGMTVGYLAREDAAKYLPGLLKLQRENGQPIALMAALLGGEPAKPSLGIWLRHDPQDFGVAPTSAVPSPIGTWTGTAAGEMSWAERLPSDRLAAIKYLRSYIAKETKPVERHFMLNELEETLYKCRDVFPAAVVEYEEVCVQHDSEMVSIRPMLIAALGGVPFLPTYKQMAIMKQKAKDFQGALWWIERGLELYGEDFVREDVVQDLRKRGSTCRARLDV